MSEEPGRDYVIHLPEKIEEAWIARHLTLCARNTFAKWRMMDYQEQARGLEHVRDWLDERKKEKSK